MENFPDWMRILRWSYGLLILFGWVQLAAGHPDYEQTIARISGSNGTTYSILCHRTDGIVTGDPVRLEIRDDTGLTLAKTPYLRDVVLTYNSDESGRAYAVGADHSFWRGWIVKDGRFDEAPVTVSGVARAFVAHLASNWLGYSLSVLICVAGFTACMRRSLKSPDCRGPLPWTFWWAIIWLALVAMYGSQSLVIVLCTTLAASLPVVLWTILRWRSQPSGPAVSAP